MRPTFRPVRRKNPMLEGLPVDNPLAGALAGMTSGWVVGFPISSLGHCGNFQAESATNRGEPLSAPAIVGAAAPSLGSLACATLIGAFGFW
jgi:hypothetical protein